MKKKVIIALINNQGTLPTSFVISLINLYNHTKQFVETELALINSTYVCQMRNEAINYSINKEASHVFMVDVDMIYPKDSIIKLLKRNKSIIGGLYYKRQFPHSPVHWKKNNFKGLHKSENIEHFESGKLKKVEASGGGGVLIKLSSIKKLKQPYFQVRYLKNSCKCVGEDIDFCYKIKNKLDFWIDPTIKYAHLHTVAITGNNQISEIQ